MPNDRKQIPKPIINTVYQLPFSVFPITTDAERVERYDERKNSCRFNGWYLSDQNKKLYQKACLQKKHRWQKKE